MPELRTKTAWHDWSVLIGIIVVLLSIWYNSLSSAEARGRLEQKVDDLVSRVSRVERNLDSHIRQQGQKPESDDPK